MSLVSIITPNYNSEKFISDTIKSVQNQTYENWEMIIVDDLSTDTSIEIIESYSKKDDRIKLFQLDKNQGAAVCRNKAISLAKGRYIAFLDSDDLWLPNKLELQISFMSKNNYALTYTSYNRIDENNKDLNSIVNCKTSLTYSDMLSSNKIGCLTAVYDTNVLGKVYMPNIRKRQDYALWLKILKMISLAYGLQVVLSKYRVREGSMSKNKIEMLKWNWTLFRHVEKMSVFKSLICLMNNVFHKILSR